MGYSFMANPRSSLRSASPIMRCRTRFCSAVKMGLRPRGLLPLEGFFGAFRAFRAMPIMLSYATTIHKSQGSEYPAVVIPIHTQHYVLLQRNLLYTAITRGRKLVVLVGVKRAIAMAAKRYQAKRRVTLLKARLERLIDGKEGGRNADGMA